MAIREGLEPRKAVKIMGRLLKSKVWVSSGKAISEVPWGRHFGTLLDTAGDAEALRAASILDNVSRQPVDHFLRNN